MSDIVKYGTFDFETVCGHVPFVGVSDEQVLLGGKFKTLKRVTIQGKILKATCGEASSIITNKINTLIAALKDDFKTLIAGGIELEYAKCESVEVSQSSFFGYATFTAVFSAYPLGLTNNQYNILDPTDTKEISEGRDGIITINRKVSARGIGTASGDAITNARTFLNSLSLSTVPTIFFIVGNLVNPGNGLKPKKYSETINRMEGTISIDIDFAYRPEAPNNSIILSYNVDIGYDDKSGLYSVQLNGSVAGGVDDTMAAVRTALNQIQFFTLAQTKLRQATGFTYLNKEPDSYSIKENEENMSISFDYTYSSDPYDVKNSVNYEYNYDYIKDIVKITVNGTITARGSEKDRSVKLETAYNSLNLYQLAQAFFAKKAVNPSLPLNKSPNSFSKTRERKTGTTTSSVSYSAEYSNQYEMITDFTKFVHTITVRPSIDYYTPIQFLDGNNGVFNLNMFKRGSVSVNGSAVGINGNLSSTVRGKMLGFLNSIKGGVESITENRVGTPEFSDDGYGYNFSAEKTLETPVFKI
jgi:hypothetical protein